MDWIDEIEKEKIEMLLNKDMALVYQECGLEVVKKLWEKLAGLNIYVSEKSLFEIKRYYIKKNYNPDDPHSKKVLAVRLDVSEDFVKKTLSNTDQKDDRQGDLL